MSAPYSWYLVRTKSNRETYVREQLSHVVPEAFLPMLKLPLPPKLIGGAAISAVYICPT